MSIKQSFISRPDYFAKLERHREKAGIIKIITGVRRCGKSTLLDMYQEKLRSEGVSNEQIVAVKFEDFANKKLSDGAELHKFVEARAAKSKKIHYVFLDEIQLVSDFAEVINSLRLRGNIDLYATGSNSSLLPHNLPKILGGKYVQVHMFPLSFKEYANTVAEKEAGLSQDKMFQSYLQYSSFPEALNYNDLRGAREYLADIYNSILVRDIMTYEGVKELSQLTRVINFMFSNIGSETSVNNMMGVINNEFKLKPNDKNLYAPMLEKYLEALLDSFLFYKANARHFGKELLRTNAKYYAVDIGLRYHLFGGAPNKDAGHILENIVYLELLRRGYKAEVGRVKTKEGDREIDFVAQKDGGKIEYYQVAQSVMDENTLKREIVPLEKINDNRPKFILTRDNDNNDYEGIRHINMLSWLLGEE